jgi:hypothetical protein
VSQGDFVKEVTLDLSDKPDAKLENPRERYLITTFCYGCNLGPTQTARSIKGLDRRQVSFVNQRHITEESLNQAITRVINAYAQLPLPTGVGLGKSNTSAPSNGTENCYEKWVTAIP